jgi:hypothetical protein
MKLVVETAGTRSASEVQQRVMMKRDVAGTTALSPSRIGP